MTILVTGGAGFIGANFVHEWIAATGEQVINLDKLTYSGNRDNLAVLDTSPDHTFVHGDIGDSGLLEYLFEQHRPRAVVNFAAESHVDRSIRNPDSFIQTNIVGVYVLLEAARTFWVRLDGPERSRFRFLHVSTDEVYGSLGAEDSAFSETSPYYPNSPYSASKAASDHLVRAWHSTYGLPVLTTNCSNNYGPYQFPEKLIPLMIHCALTDRDLPIYGDGMQVRDWLFVADHCSAIRAVLEGGRPGEVYNVGGDSERTNMVVVHTLCDLLDQRRPRADGRSYREQISHITDRPGHDRRYAVDASKIRDELGWQPTESFESGLEKTVDWYLSNTGWVERVIDGSYRDWLKTQYSET